MDMINLTAEDLFFQQCTAPGDPPSGRIDNCPEDEFSQCFARELSQCDGDYYSSRYDNASAVWVVLCAILMFFMKAGFLYVEESFSQSDKRYRRRVVLAKYIDIFAGTLGFWLFGYAVSGTTDARWLGEEQDYIFWFFRFTFATNTATILGGTLVGHRVQLRAPAVFVYSFCMTAFIHPSLARFFWSAADTAGSAPITWSPYHFCNGTFTATRAHIFSFFPEGFDFGRFVFIDFAGSGLVHVCGGIGGFVLAIFHKFETSKKPLAQRVRECCPLLRRKTDPDRRDIREAEDLPEEETPESFLEWLYPSGGGEENVESAALGILILWTTWFAFNAGSTESISGKTIHAAVGRIALCMCLTCASSGLLQTTISGLVQIYKRDETFNANEIANSVLGALVAITGCCPFIEPWFAVLIGLISVAVYHLGCFVEYLLGLHDGARVFPVHGMCGMWGVLCVGIFSRNCYIRELYGELCFCLDVELPDFLLSSTVANNGLLFAFQLAGGLFIVVWSFVLCTIVFTALWFFPVKFALTCLPWVFCFDKEERGKINFQGNILFTHFNEIGAPTAPRPTTRRGRDNAASTYKPPEPTHAINAGAGDTGYASSGM